MKNILIILLIILQMPLFAKDNTDDEKEYLNQAVADWENNNIKDCFINSNKVLKINPENILALLFRSKCYLSMDKFDLALKDSDKAFELILNSDDQNINLNYVKQELFRIKGIIYDKQGKFEPAAKELLEALKISNDDPSIFFDLAIVYNNMKQYDNALKYTENAIDLNPFNETYYSSAIYLLNTLKSDKNLYYYKERTLLLRNKTNVFYSKILPLLNHMPSDNYNSITGKEMYYELLFDGKGDQILPDIVPLINIDYVMELSIFYEKFLNSAGNYDLIRENSITKKNKKVRIKAMKIETYYEDVSTKDIHIVYKVKIEDIN